MQNKKDIENEVKALNKHLESKVLIHSQDNQNKLSSQQIRQEILITRDSQVANVEEDRKVQASQQIVQQVIDLCNSNQPNDSNNPEPFPSVQNISALSDVKSFRQDLKTNDNLKKVNVSASKSVAAFGTKKYFDENQQTNQDQNEMQDDEINLRIDQNSLKNSKLPFSEKYQTDKICDFSEEKSERIENVEQYYSLGGSSKYKQKNQQNQSMISDNYSNFTPLNPPTPKYHHIIQQHNNFQSDYSENIEEFSMANDNKNYPKDMIGIFKNNECSTPAPAPFLHESNALEKDQNLNEQDDLNNSNVNSRRFSENGPKSCSESQKKSPFKFKKSKINSNWVNKSDIKSNFENNCKIIFQNQNQNLKSNLSVISPVKMSKKMFDIQNVNDKQSQKNVNLNEDKKKIEFHKKNEINCNTSQIVYKNNKKLQEMERKEIFSTNDFNLNSVTNIAGEYSKLSKVEIEQNIEDLKNQIQMLQQQINEQKKIQFSTQFHHQKQDENMCISQVVDSDLNNGFGKVNMNESIVTFDGNNNMTQNNQSIDENSLDQNGIQVYNQKSDAHMKNLQSQESFKIQVEKIHSKSDFEQEHEGINNTQDQNMSFQSNANVQSQENEQKDIKLCDIKVKVKEDSINQNLDALKIKKDEKSEYAYQFSLKEDIKSQISVDNTAQQHVQKDQAHEAHPDQSNEQHQENNAKMEDQNQPAQNENQTKNNNLFLVIHKDDLNLTTQEQDEDLLCKKNQKKQIFSQIIEPNNESMMLKKENDIIVCKQSLIDRRITSIDQIGKIDKKSAMSQSNKPEIKILINQNTEGQTSSEQMITLSQIDKQTLQTILSAFQLTQHDPESNFSQFLSNKTKHVEKSESQNQYNQLEQIDDITIENILQILLEKNMKQDFDTESRNLEYKNKTHQNYKNIIVEFLNVFKSLNSQKNKKIIKKKIKKNQKKLAKQSTSKSKQKGKMSSKNKSINFSKHKKIPSQNPIIKDQAVENKESTDINIKKNSKIQQSQTSESVMEIVLSQNQKFQSQKQLQVSPKSLQQSVKNKMIKKKDKFSYLKNVQKQPYFGQNQSEFLKNEKKSVDKNLLKSIMKSPSKSKSAQKKDNASSKKSGKVSESKTKAKPKKHVMFSSSPYKSVYNQDSNMSLSKSLQESLDSQLSQEEKFQIQAANNNQSQAQSNQQENKDQIQNESQKPLSEVLILQKLYSQFQHNHNTEEDNWYCDICLDTNQVSANQDFNLVADSKIALQEEKEELVICDLCLVVVHPSCHLRELFKKYDPQDQSPWYCERCQFLIDQYNQNPKYLMNEFELPQCMLCNDKMGSIVQLVTREWVHQTCVNWHNEIWFHEDNINYQDKYLQGQLNYERFNEICSICKQDPPIGSCIDCDFDTCNKKFHVRCAIKAGLILAQEDQYMQELRLGDWECKIFCNIHTNIGREKIKQIKFQRGKTKEQLCNYSPLKAVKNRSIQKSINKKLVQSSDEEGGSNQKELVLNSDFIEPINQLLIQQQFTPEDLKLFKSELGTMLAQQKEQNAKKIDYDKIDDINYIKSLQLQVDKKQSAKKQKSIFEEQHQIFQKVQAEQQKQLEKYQQKKQQFRSRKQLKDNGFLPQDLQVQEKKPQIPEYKSQILNQTEEYSSHHTHNSTITQIQNKNQISFGLNNDFNEKDALLQNISGSTPSISNLGKYIGITPNMSSGNSVNEIIKQSLTQIQTQIHKNNSSNQTQKNLEYLIHQIPTTQKQTPYLGTRSNARNHRGNHFNLKQNNQKSDKISFQNQIKMGILQAFNQKNKGDIQDAGGNQQFANSQSLTEKNLNQTTKDSSQQSVFTDTVLNKKLGFLQNQNKNQVQQKQNFSNQYSQIFLKNEEKNIELNPVKSLNKREKKSAQKFSQIELKKDKKSVEKQQSLKLEDIDVKSKVRFKIDKELADYLSIDHWCSFREITLGLLKFNKSTGGDFYDRQTTSFNAYKYPYFLKFFPHLSNIKIRNQQKITNVDLRKYLIDKQKQE